MDDNAYIFATHHSWNIDLFNDTIIKYSGNWTLITKKEELNVDTINKIKPKYIFFPHWSYIVPDEILDLVDCVCFHAAKLPAGRGGTPVQHQIIRGLKETEVCALKMSRKVDAGPIYLREKVSLEGLAEEIYIRFSKIISKMILEMITHDITPKPQEGKVIVYDRRKPEESEIPENFDLSHLFDFLRMLDAEGYPRAFIKYGKYRLEFTRPAMRYKKIDVDVKITIDED